MTATTTYELVDIKYTSSPSCTKSASGTAVVTVNPLPSFTQPSDIIACANSEIANISFSGSDVSGTTYSWTNDNTAIGLASSGTGDISSFTAQNSTNSPITANITVVPTANSCEGTSQTFKITVNPTTTVSDPSDLIVCNSETVEAVDFVGSNVSGKTYKWTNDNPAIGLGASGTGNIASFNATNNSSEPMVANITVTPVANDCDGTPQTFSITVNPTTTFTKPEDIIICNGESVSTTSFSGSSVTGNQL